jgi:PAS domain S-box-containing protein
MPTKDTPPTWGDQLLAFQEITSLINSSLDLQQTLDAIAKITTRLVGTQYASIAVREPGTDYLVMGPSLGHLGSSQEFVESFRLHINEGVGGVVMQTKQPYVVYDSDLEPLFTHVAARREGMRSWICAPLLSKSEALGVLYALNQHPTYFSDEQVKLMMVLANHAAIAVTNARAFEDTLSEKRRIEAVIANMADGVVMLDRTGHIVSVNPTLTRMLGLPAEQLIGAAWRDMPYQMQLFKDNEELSISDPFAVVAEMQTGEPLNKVLKIYISPVRDSNEQLLGQVMVMHDVTREREMEQIKSDFVSTVSHELRTPLFSIRGFVKLILDGKVPDEATRTEFLTIVSQQSDQLMGIVNDLLDVSRLDAGREIDMNWETVEPGALITDTVTRLSNLASDKQLTLLTEVTPPLPLVRVDVRRFSQVLTNLIGNAIKFTPEGGCIKVSATGNDDGLLVNVMDNGQGIPADAVPRLFDRFYQVDHSGTRKAGGTGLGLYICKQIIESFGGRIDVESILGKGSRFWFQLPKDESGELPSLPNGETAPDH